jgi:hypothetical protein
MGNVCTIWMNWESWLFPVNLKRRVSRVFMENLGGFGASSSWIKMTDEEEVFFYQFLVSLPQGRWEKVELSKLPNGDILCILYAETDYALSMAFNIFLGLPGTFAPASLVDEINEFAFAFSKGNLGMMLVSLKKARLKLNAE